MTCLWGSSTQFVILLLFSAVSSFQELGDFGLHLQNFPLLFLQVSRAKIPRLKFNSPSLERQEERLVAGREMHIHLRGVTLLSATTAKAGNEEKLRPFQPAFFFPSSFHFRLQRGFLLQMSSIPRRNFISIFAKQFLNAACWLAGCLRRRLPPSLISFPSIRTFGTFSTPFLVSPSR